VFHELQDCRKSYKILRSSHLRSWAMKKCAEFNDSSLKFKAGKTWLSNFNSRHNIGSRKINRLVSKREVKSEQQIMQSAKRFQAEIKQLANSFDKTLIFNTDQCGFSYEITSARTLTVKGDKIVFGYAQSPKNLSTHSYTVQYIISMAGEILGNVFLCLQEPGGKFGPRLKVDVESYLPPNITLTCSTSGKLSTSLNEYFIEKQLVPHVNGNFLWIIDSWTGHTNIDSYLKFFNPQSDGPQITLKVIPEKCTPLAQPLDTTFHRQLKYLAREICAALEIYINVQGVNQEDNWNTRKGVLKLQSLLHFQLKSPIFVSMIKYSWYSSGLTDEKVAFQNVKKVCFTFADTDPPKCQIIDCDNQRFIKCSFCRKCICIHDFWIQNHFYVCEDSTFII